MDLDDDGDLDLVAGKNDGSIGYYENTGNKTAAVFEKRTGAGVNPFHGITGVSSGAVPAFADLDGDGDLDLAVGRKNGGVNYYENIGAAAAPTFVERASDAGAGANPFHGINVGWLAAPAVADLDGDQAPEFVFGMLTGKLLYYQSLQSLQPRIEFYTRDANGNIIRTDYDDNGNGRAARSHIDPNGDGVLDRIETYYERDEQGNSLRTGFDDDANNAVDRIESYVRDVNGRIIRTDFDDDADNTVDRVEVYTRNAAGAVIGAYYDDDVDGVIDRAAFDDEGDGAVDRIETYSYDAHGNLVKKVMAVGGEGDAGDAPAAEPEGVSLGRSAAGAPGARGVAGRETVAAGDAVARTPFESMLEELGEGAVIRSETYTRNAAGAVVRTDYDEGDDGTIESSSFDEAGDGVVERSETYAHNAAGDVVRTEVERDDDALVDEYRYDHDANGRVDWVGRDGDNDGMVERLEFHGQWGAAGNRVTHTITLLGAGPAYAVAFHDGDGLLLASGWSDAGPGALDGFAYSAGLAVVSELQTAATSGSADALLPVDATLLAGVSRIDLAGGGAGSTDLTLSAESLAVLADGDGNYQLRIDGDGDDTLRFDLDDSTRGDDVAVGGESYEQYAGTTGRFIVDPDVTLVTA